MLRSRQLLRSAFRAAGAALGGTAGVVACQVAYVRLSFQLPPDATGPTSGTASAAALRSSGTRRNIIFLGDSLVTGVGCDAEAGEGPTLPRRVAELLSGRLGVDVGWLALGETGADVGTLTERLMPQVARCGAQGERLNPHAFAGRLRGVVEAVRTSVGDECAVLLPGVSVEGVPSCPLAPRQRWREPCRPSPRFAAGVPRFEPFWPLSTCIARAAGMWEEQKRTVAHEMSVAGQRVAFSAQAGRLLPTRDIFCRDGMHPNDRGYAIWAELVAEDLLSAMALPPKDSGEAPP
ncbi:hypothetical protein EMIHUDRAFT_248192 [Emiliania huxleyi CCMP1516]|uniref:SGNH hydrolase-type esterase domain-containing protein n=2 Tax=Emiliania huxleyi TaxID=2903 RepID=A0A0D3IHT5_EMIH1|nr:hypothetical protein EMIHUDRAFT_248192 [Emiliania huxleyi CCMP1516]EOD10820.1 hypothetical protein EMIHUDRAFT_248192 [Emiliania huxleyi CCMP1516]|eukprot:XP_005763249.1 hypothetical protein EMIHUDRAFT_248192 [Emiliania huxleyi CCMP1516]